MKPTKIEKVSEDRYKVWFGDEKLFVTKSRERGYFGVGDVENGEPHLNLYKMAAGVFKTLPFPEIHVLDVCCGSGYGCFYFHANAWKTTGVDNSEEAISFARHRAPNTELHRCEATELPFKDMSFEAVNCIEGIEHVEDDVKAMKEMCRVLKPGGRLCITAPEQDHAYDLSPFHIREYTQPEFIQLLHDAGLVVVGWARTEARTMFVVCMKRDAG